jgi:ferredoxin
MNGYVGEDPMGLEVSVDHVRCSGCGSCIELCPEIFAWDEAGEKAVVRRDGAGECVELDAAVTICPQDCITVHQEEAG